MDKKQYAEMKSSEVLGLLKKRDFKSFFKWLWYFIWDSNSIWSWVVNIILAFIIIKFVVYPVLGLTLATSHPIVAVVSGSMEHDGSFDDWWASQASCELEKCMQSEFYTVFNISKQDFKDFRFKNGFNKGDIMILKGVKPEKIKVGDVLIFKSYRPDPIIHRVIKVWEEEDALYYQTKGDHNMASFSDLDEDRIHEDRVIGKAVVRIPLLGWIKIVAVNIWYVLIPR